MTLESGGLVILLSGEVAEGKSFDSTRVQALTALAAVSTSLSRSWLYPHLRETLHLSAGATRTDLLSDLVALLPVIFRLGGAAAVVEMAHAIRDAGEWWP